MTKEEKAEIEVCAQIKAAATAGGYVECPLQYVNIPARSLSCQMRVGGQLCDKNCRMQDFIKDQQLNIARLTEMLASYKGKEEPVAEPTPPVLKVGGMAWYSAKESRFPAPVRVKKIKATEIVVEYIHNPSEEVIPINRASTIIPAVLEPYCDDELPGLVGTKIKDRSGSVMQIIACHKDYKRSYICLAGYPSCGHLTYRTAEELMNSYTAMDGMPCCNIGGL